MRDMEHRIKSELKMSEDKSEVTLSYKFRGYDEALAFQQMVRTLLTSSEKFFKCSDEIEQACSQEK